jgi:hypothetical protein
MDETEHVSIRNDAAQAVSAQSQTQGPLKPKGACWYCNQPLDNVRRFCSKTCADDYRTEEEAFSAEPR